MKGIGKRDLIWLVGGLLAVFLSACGGGGGSGGGDGGADLNYSGITEQAILTANNAEDLAMESYSLERPSIHMPAIEASPLPTKNLRFHIFMWVIHGIPKYVIFINNNIYNKLQR